MYVIRWEGRMTINNWRNGELFCNSVHNATTQAVAGFLESVYVP